jgi:hypothetical protein
MSLEQLIGFGKLKIWRPKQFPSGHDIRYDEVDGKILAEDPTRRNGGHKSFRVIIIAPDERVEVRDMSPGLPSPTNRVARGSEINDLGLPWLRWRE